jgi:ferric-dicitrate binding protein FerR (iron transport regulator)
VKINRNVSRLIASHLKGKLSDQEYQELEDWVTESEENMQVFLKLTDKTFAGKELKQFQAIDANTDIEWGKVLNKRKHEFTQRRVIRMVKYAAVLVFLAGLGIQSYRMLTSETTPNKATFAKLDSLTNPAGSQPRLLKLPDGTNVWLGDSSGIVYAASFNKNERNVDVYGRVYFEVNHLQAADGKKIPFIVNIRDRDQHIRVMGTIFNVEAYRGEEVRTTLLQGSVKMNAGSDTCKLEPGQQAIHGSGGFEINKIATEAVVAWKANFFQFDRATINEVMNELCRWYKVTVEYQVSEFPKHVSIQPIQRDISDISLEDLLHGIERTAELHFRFDKNRRKIIVTK